MPQSAKESSASNKTRSLNEAVSKLREQAQSVQRNLEFSVDDASGETVVKVVASDTGEVIRQIPSEVALKLAESLKEAGNLLFSERA
ncbi:MAG: flagellar protein FlaG [Pseudomonas sp.]